MHTSGMNEQAPTLRSVTQVIDAQSLLEGGGFPVRRPFPTASLSSYDPFLLLDHMGPVNWPPGEALGAPDHPHRGFEAVTYLLAGKMQHRDSAGNRGELGPGDVQWMTAGSGIIHSELPDPDFRARGGVLHGFQLWVNLPASHKMMAPRYQDIPAAGIPAARNADGTVKVRVIAGKALGTRAVIDTVIPITYLHFTLQPGACHVQPLAVDEQAFAYVFGGELLAGPTETRVREGQTVFFGAGEAVSLAVDKGEEGPVELLLLAGAPLNEPVVRHGPFVMNTREEIEQALRDYRDGVLA